MELVTNNFRTVCYGLSALSHIFIYAFMLGGYNNVVYALTIWRKLLLYMPGPTTSQTLSLSFLSKKNYNLPYVHGNTQLTINVLLHTM